MGKKLGPGHHGDDEYEYEIHHFEKFHDECEFCLFLATPWLCLVFFTFEKKA